MEFQWPLKLFSTMSNPPSTMLSMDVNFQILCRICFCVAMLALMYLSLMSNCMLLLEPLRCKFLWAVCTRYQAFTSMQSFVDYQMFLEVKSLLTILAYMRHWPMLLSMLVSSTERLKCLCTMFTVVSKSRMVS